LIVDPTLHAGWPRRLPVEPAWQTLYVDQNATVADLDGDGRPEMIVSQGATIHAFRADGTEAPGWPRTVPAGQQTQRSPAVGDLDGDGVPEVVVTSNDWGVLVYEHDGTLRFTRTSPQYGSVGQFAAIGDVGGDGKNEIVVSGDRVPEVNVLDGQGNAFGGTGGRCPIPAQPGAVHTMPSPPALGDLDGDGKDEIVILQREAELMLYVCRPDGTYVPGFPVDLGPSSYAAITGAPVVGDVTGDGRLDIVVASPECAISALDAHGHMLPGFPWAPDPVAFEHLTLCGPVTLADLDGNRASEVLLGAFNLDTGNGLPYPGSVMWAVDGAGQVLPGWPHSFGYSHPTGGPAVADLDGDSRREIAVDGDEFFSVHAVEADGSEISAFPKPTMATPINGVVNVPAIGDFDGDGLLEMFWVSGQTPDAEDNLLPWMYLWDLTAPALPTTQDWPMYRHDAAHTGAQLGTTCAPGACAPSLPFADGFEAGTAAWAVAP
jgi:hypothetical protein